MAQEGAAAKLGLSLDALITTSRKDKAHKPAEADGAGRGRRGGGAGPARTARGGGAARERRRDDAQPFKQRKRKHVVADDGEDAAEDDDDAGDASAAWKHDRAPRGGRVAHFHAGPSSSVSSGALPPISTAKLGTTVTITNLDPSITAEQIHQIFSKVGEIRTVSMHFTSSGSSRGAADVLYRTRAGAEAAVRDFDGREVDDVRISVRIVADAPIAVAPVAAARPAPAGVRFHATLSAPPPSVPKSGLFSNMVYTKNPRAAAPEEEVERAVEHTGRGGGRGGGGRGRGGRGAGRGGRAAPPPPADLDAELSKYMEARA